MVFSIQLPRLPAIIQLLKVLMSLFLVSCQSSKKDFNCRLVLTIKVLARKGEPLEFTNPQARSCESAIAFHVEPNGAAVFALGDGGCVYMKDSEVIPSNGGDVYGVEFDS